MGSRIALRLAHKGHKVTVFNRDKSKCETGANSHALRPEFKDLYLQEEEVPATTSSQQQCHVPSA
jgi:3-hydroxyisobutyrate dehydrogenase-like beta-hydroxyacid dehydrogenase